jgi:hypothetical protein
LLVSRPRSWPCWVVGRPWRSCSTGEKSNTSSR